ncbi:MAG: chemotaxis protein CheW [Gammaproteobacteria bacterium]|nr:chemotaxis protein CheW [Gammaproteobacteria bacterium]NVK89048.1 chemotaxis protein CheW [Gammaproteobacteria bacterium]
MSKPIQQYLSFELDENEYAISILRIQEIRGYEKTKALPNAQKYIVGVINLRGSVIPIIDLRVRFGIEKKSYSATTVVIIVHIKFNGRYRKVGLIVDGVNEVYDVNDSDIQECTDIMQNIDLKFIKGITALDEKMVTIIDLDKVFDFKDIEQVMAPTQ